MKIFNRGEKPSWGVSLIPFVALVAVLVLVIKGFGADALSGGSQVALMFAAGVTVAIGMVFYRIPWKDFENAMVDNISSVATSVIILLLIGVLVATILRLPIIILTTINIIPENIFSLIMKYSNIVISIPFTIISSIIIDKKKSNYKNSLTQKLKETKEEYYQELENQKNTI